MISHTCLIVPVGSPTPSTPVPLFGAAEAVTAGPAMASAAMVTAEATVSSRHQPVDLDERFIRTVLTSRM